MWDASKEVGNIAHKVKCLYCGEIFDRDKEPFKIAPTHKNRYVHLKCYNIMIEQEKRNKEEKIILESYICNLFNLERITASIEKQIKGYLSKNDYSYKGIYQSLVYFYEIKNGDLEKAHGRIGIVPYIYAEAQDYYSNIKIAKEKNKVATSIEVSTPEDIVYISPPERHTMTNTKLFDFLNCKTKEGI